MNIDQYISDNFRINMEKHVGNLWKLPRDMIYKCWIFHIFLYFNGLVGHLDRKAPRIDGLIRGFRWDLRNDVGMMLK